ncbi:ABC transporter ATP-binding protein [Streptomyces sp. NPDC001002]
MKTIGTESAPRTVQTTRAAASVAAGVKTYDGPGGEVRALDRVTVEFAAGECTAVLGPAGSGKSALLRCAAGLDRLTAGRARIADTDLGSLDERELTLLRRTRVGFVLRAFEGYGLAPGRTLREDLLMPWSLAGVRPDPALVDELVDRLGLGTRLGRRPGELSTGELRSAAVARALIHGPEIVFVDEPSVGAADGALRFLRETAVGICRTIVAVTRDPEVAAHADRAVFLAGGRVVDTLRHPTASAVRERLRQYGLAG